MTNAELTKKVTETLAAIRDMPDLKTPPFVMDEKVLLAALLEVASCNALILSEIARRLPEGGADKEKDKVLKTRPSWGILERLTRGKKRANGL